MNTSQYPADNRKQFKRDQRTPAYRDLQKRAAEERGKLESTIRTRNEVIDRLKKKLAAVGVTEAEVAQLAA
jgi:predicted nuclease with TOPRIM domain